MTSTLQTAADLDAADALAGYRQRFVLDGDVVAYLDGNSLGRPLRSVAEDLPRFVEHAWGQRLIRSWDERWMDEPTTVGDRLGVVVLGAAAGQVTLGDSTSVLLYKLIRAAVDASPDRREVVIDRANFPTDRFLVEGVAAERGVTIRWLDGDPVDGVALGDIEPVLGPHTALIVLSHVAYRTGAMADAAAITASVHDVGALMLWDLSHSVGSVPVALDRWGADLAVGCTYKYLNGGPGAPAFCFVRRDLQERLRQPLWGWMGAASPFEMTLDYAPAPGIRQFLTGTPSILAMQPLQAMLDLIEQAGMTAIREKSRLLTERAVGWCDEVLKPLGASLASPRDPDRRGSHILVAHPAARSAVAALWRRGVIPDFRPPDGIRIGLSPLSTSFAELDLGMAALGDELTARR